MPEEVNLPEDKEVDEYLTPEEAETFKSLLVVGRLSGTYTVYGHRITLATTTVDEDIQVGLVIKPFMDSYAFERAYRVAMVAAFIREIDGRPLVQSLTHTIGDDSTSVSAKFEKLKDYYPPVIDEIFLKVQELEKQLLPLLSRLGKTLS